MRERGPRRYGIGLPAVAKRSYAPLAHPKDCRKPSLPNKRRVLEWMPWVVLFGLLFGALALLTAQLRLSAEVWRARGGDGGLMGRLAERIPHHRVLELIDRYLLAGVLVNGW